MNTLIKAMCLLAIPIFVSAYVIVNAPIDSNGSSGTGIGPIENTLGSLSYGNTGGIDGPENLNNLYLDIFNELYVMHKLLYKMSGFMSLLIIMNCMLLYYIYQTSVSINTDKKFVSEQKILFIVCIIATVIFSIYVCIR